MLVVVIRKVIGIALIANNKQLNKTKQGLCVSVPRVVFLLHDLLHGAPRTDIVCFQLDLYDRNPVDQ